MASALTAAPVYSNYQSLRRFSVAEYHRMIDTGILDATDKVELLEGYVVLKMARNPPHDSTIQRLQRHFFRILPAGWDVRGQSAITLAESEPEPDLAVVRGDDTRYQNRHPGPADVGLIVEVADSSLDRDRLDKGRIYAHAGIPGYWLINLVDHRVEVYTGPSGSGYSQRQDFGPGTSVPLVLDGGTVATLAAKDLLP